MIQLLQRGIVLLFHEHIVAALKGIRVIEVFLELPVEVIHLDIDGVPFPLVLG